VLARQSWLFNQFKYLCELRDVLQESPMRDGGLEAALWVASLLNSVGSDGSQLQATGTVLTKAPHPAVPRDRIQRWLKTLAVPPVPPCPIGGVASARSRASATSSAASSASSSVAPSPRTPATMKTPGKSPRTPRGAK
jgi:hypothetical protein